MDCVPFSCGAFKHCDETLEAVFGNFGTFSYGENTTEQLKIYNRSGLLKISNEIENFLKVVGVSIRYFSFVSDLSHDVTVVVPNLGKQNYSTGDVWIYDPRILEGSFFDVDYTRNWRITHEVGHAVVEPFLQRRYGPSRRQGRIGYPHLSGWSYENGEPVLKKGKPHTHRALSVRHAQRAVEWEALAFRVQRMILEELGLKISDEEYNKEYAINLAGAIYRVITGEFPDPGLSGFVPDGRDTNLVDALALLENVGDQILEISDEFENPPIWHSGIDLSKWVDVSDQELNLAYAEAKRVGISVLHKNRDNYEFFRLPLI